MKQPLINSRNHGFGLIEILITLLVFSIGVLAVAGLQALSKKNNYDALQRTTAAGLAESIVASMRANPRARDAYITGTGSPIGSNGTSQAPANCYQAACDPQDMAAFDLYVWEQGLNGAGEILVLDGDAIETGGLVNPSACILGPADGSAGFYQVVIAWRGVTKLGEAQNHSCGAGRGLYDTGDAADNASYQRFFVLRTFIGQ